MVAPAGARPSSAVSSSRVSLSQVDQRETGRTKDISDLQRRLSHLTNAIDDTLHRGEKRTQPTSSPAPARPVSDSSGATPAVAVPSTFVPTSKVFSLVSRSSSAASASALLRPATALDVPEPTVARPLSPRQQHRKRLMSPDIIPHASDETSRSASATTRPNALPTGGERHHEDPHASLEPKPARNSTAALRSGPSGPTNPRTQLSLDDPLPALREEEDEIRLRIAALKRIEAEKMDLIAHQKRLLELDNERHRLEDERRRRSVSKAHSTAGGAGSVSPSVSGVSLSPLPHREQQPHNVQSFALLERSDMADDAVATTRQQDLHHRHGAPASSSSPWGSQPVQHHQAAPLQSSTALRYVSRSPSPILHLQSASPARGEESTHRVLRNAITGSSPHHRSSPGGSRWVPTAKGDQRFVCRELLVERGIDAKVLTGHDRAIPCKLHLSPNHQELLALPVDQSGGLMTESHHFPLRGAALLYPNGTIQHTWLPKRVHVSGVVVGNRAKSVLLSKGCPHFVSTARENRPRLYLVVGGDAYSDEATLLVLQFGSRLEWLCVLLGLHGAMWPDGKPPLTPGRALWLYACHAVTQLQWEANTTSDNLWHQSRRRSRSADPHKRLMADGSVPRLPLSNYRTSTPPPQQARAPPEQHYHQQPAVLATPSSSGRFAVPLTPAASVSPTRHQPPSAPNHVIISSNTSDARSAMVAPSQLSRAYPSSANRQVPSLAPYQQPGAQHQLQQRGRPVQVAPNQQGLATLPNGFTLVGSTASVASSTYQRAPPPPQHQQLQQQAPSTSAPRTTFFPKSQSRQGGRQSVLQYGY